MSDDGRRPPELTTLLCSCTAVTAAAVVVVSFSLCDLMTETGLARGEEGVGEGVMSSENGMAMGTREEEVVVVVEDRGKTGGTDFDVDTDVVDTDVHDAGRDE